LKIKDKVTQECGYNGQKGNEQVSINIAVMAEFGSKQFNIASTPFPEVATVCRHAFNEYT